MRESDDANEIRAHCLSFKLLINSTVINYIRLSQQMFKKVQFVEKIFFNNVGNKEVVNWMPGLAYSNSIFLAQKYKHYLEANIKF